MVFGSIDCKQCSVWWLLSLIVYGVVGLIFIWFLFIFKLTITTDGKLNRIIFYAQVVCIVQVQKVSVSHHDFLSVYYTLARGLISLINLTINFNFPLCFYHGMTELWKSGLSLVFPVYLLAIVIGLIIISRYSVRLSNRIADSSVQVLVTIVHLSFATLLTSTMDVFTPVYVYTNTSDVPLKVWQNDGTVEYGKGGHLILMIVTGVLVVGSILITYFTVLLAGRPLMKIKKVREYLCPIYEAIHAPYKHDKEFFFAVTIILTAFFYFLHDIFYSFSSITGLIIGVIVLFVFSISVSYTHPYKENGINLLNFLILSVLSVMAMSTLFTFVTTTFIFVAVLGVTDSIVVFILICIILSEIDFLKKLRLKAAAFIHMKFKRNTMTNADQQIVTHILSHVKKDNHLFKL